jgi:filamentous hemagglutinin
MLAGRPACALPGRVTPASKLSEYFGTRWSKEMKTEADMAAAMKSAGPGKRAVVFGLPAGTTTGHFFNVVNQDGAIRFLDGQSGTSANVAPYTKFWLLPTN